MTTRDPSQMPIEHLAQLLLQFARDDAALPRRPPANDDPAHSWLFDDMHSRVAALPQLQREAAALQPKPRELPSLLPDAHASDEDLEELVAIALTSAQDAEDLAREAQEAGVRARRDMVVALAVALMGVVIAAASLAFPLLYRDDAQQMAAIAAQVKAMGGLQRQINDQLTEQRVQAVVQEASAAAPSPAPAAAVAAPPPKPVQSAPAALPPPPASPAPNPATRALLAPLPATPVAVLPAHAMEPPQPPQPVSIANGNADRSTLAARTPAEVPPQAAYSPAPGFVPAPVASAYSPPVIYRRVWTGPRRPVRRYRSAIVLPQPVLYLFGTIHRVFR